MKVVSMEAFIIFVFFVSDSVAQLVEQLTLNQRAESSSLSGVTGMVSRKAAKNAKAPLKK